MSIFVKTISLLRASENHLLSARESEIRFISYLSRITWQPMKFLRMGMAEKTKGATLWSLLSFTSLMIGTALINSAPPIEREIANWIMILSMVAPMFLVVFAMPSMYVNSGVEAASVAFVVEYIQENSLEIKDIELLKKSLKLFEDRARSRVNILKWLVGLLWAAFMYTFTKGLNTSTWTPEELQKYAFGSAILFLFVIGAYLVVWGYEAALDKLFRLIEFGCNDFCQLENRSPPGST